jgi:drug/metabolite transporter (DMT)-like permease
MAYLILFASIIAFTAYVWLIAREPTTRVASYAYVNPVIALLLGSLLAHERPTPVQYAGAALVLAGVASTITGKRVKR